MYQLTVEPYTYPVYRTEAEALLFKATGRLARSTAPTPAELAQVNLVTPATAPQPEGEAVKDSSPSLINGTWQFGWSI